ncbi:MAG: helix-turn-helix domain-containing protein [Bacteroides sp.]|nr:helix-turn-helix domain-containing protein [Bacteroides sp.]MCM1550547.1 helix-turn-helix domain-containing protein [Clostridium sp.]
MIGKQIKELRKSKHLTQTELSEYLNVGQSTLANFENGKRIIPVDIIIKLANYFNVTTDYLLGLSPALSSFSTQEPVHGEQLSEDESKLLNTYRSLGADEKQIVLGKALDLKLSSSVEARKKKDIG